MTQIDLHALLARFQALLPEHQEIILNLTDALATRSETTISMPLTAYIDPWLQHLTNQGRSPHTVRVYCALVQPFITAYPCPTPIDLETYLTLRHNKVAPVTQLSFSIALRNFFGYLAERGIPAMQPSDVPTIVAQRRRRLAPPPEHVARLLAYPELKLRSRALLYILIDCGPRISEILSLRRVDCDLPHCQLHITKAKGNKQRTVPISERTARVLADHLQSHSSSYAFPGSRASLSWNITAAEEHMKRLCQQVGIPPITPHQFRHFFATQAINSGANIRSVSEILGHEAPSITMDIYLHTNQELNRQQHTAHSPLSKMLDRKEVD